MLNKKADESIIKVLIFVAIMVFIIVLVAKFGFDLFSGTSESNNEKVARQSFNLFYANLESVTQKTGQLTVSEYQRITLTLPKNFFIYGFHNLADHEVNIINPDKCGKNSCVCLFHGEYETINMDNIKIENNNYNIPESEYDKHLENSEKAIVCEILPQNPITETIPNIYTQYTDNINFDKTATQAVELIKGEGFSQTLVLGARRITDSNQQYKTPVWLQIHGTGTTPDQKNLPAQGFQVNKKAQLILGVMPEESITQNSAETFCAPDSGTTCGEQGFAVNVGQSQDYNNPYMSAQRCQGVNCGFPAVCYYQISFPQLGESLLDIASSKDIAEYEGSCILPGYNIQLEKQYDNNIAGKLNTYTTIVEPPTGSENTVSPDYNNQPVKQATPFATNNNKNLWCGDTFLNKDGLLMIGSYRDESDYCIYKEATTIESFNDYENSKTVYLTLTSDYSGTASNIGTS